MRHARPGRASCQGYDLKGSNVGLSTCSGVRKAKGSRTEGEWEGAAGKAAGSAGVCTTDTCLDSITAWNHSFLPIKMKKKKEKKGLSAPSGRIGCRIGNCFENRVYHPLPGPHLDHPFLLLPCGGHPSAPAPRGTSTPRVWRHVRGLPSNGAASPRARGCVVCSAFFFLRPPPSLFYLFLYFPRSPLASNSCLLSAIGHAWDPSVLETWPAEIQRQKD